MTEQQIAELLTSGEATLTISALLILGLWLVRRWKALEALSTKQELVAIGTAVLSVVAAQLALGADTRQVVLQAIITLLAALKWSSPALPAGLPTATPSPRKRRPPPPILIVLLAAGLVVGCAGSGLQLQRQAADQVAKLVNRSLPELALLEQQEGDRAIDAASSAEDAERRLGAVRATWKPIWASVRAAQAAHDTWADQLEAGTVSDTTVLQLHRCYCDLREVIAGRLTLPDHPLAPCAEVSQ